MKITANRVDDILKQREEYDTETKKFKDRQEAAISNWRSAYNEAGRAIEKKVADLIGSTSLTLNIVVDSHFGSDTWRVTVNANPNKNFDDNVALVWNFDVSLDENGNIVKDSSSWSGLKAITPEQISNLEESVRVIKILNNIDWASVLESPQPSYEDYSDKAASDAYRARKNERPDFESQIISAQIEDIIAAGDEAIKLSNDSVWRGEVYILPTRISDKFVTGYIFPKFYLTSDETVESIKQKTDERRTAKSNLVKISNDELSTIKFNK